MLTRRIVACLDVDAGRVVKGVRFENLGDMGDPSALAAFYDAEGADEICLLDISATVEGRRAMLGVVESVAAAVTVPLSAGGGVCSAGDARDLLRAGADKVCINSAAARNPRIVGEMAAEFGCQCVVVAVDAAGGDRGRRVVLDGGRTSTPLEPAGWAAEAERLGAGEILLTSIGRDGTGSGFDVELVREVASAVAIPVVASGGAGCMRHFLEAFRDGGASAALAAGLFHRRELSIRALKDWLSSMGVPVRTAWGG
jgi:imidazole glycerol-phosphate synthase subunit HisF